jgi:hypothetical protein
MGHRRAHLILGAVYLVEIKASFGVEGDDGDVFDVILYTIGDWKSRRNTLREGRFVFRLGR